MVGPMNYAHIALIKTLSLFLVVAMHCVIFFATPFPFWKLYADAPQAFADVLTVLSGATIIQCFMFASGFLFAASWDAGKRTPLQYLAHRARRLLLPWFGVGMLWIAPLYTLFSIPAFGHPADATLLETWKVVSLGLFTDHLWFLLVLFWVTLFWVAALLVLKKCGRDTALAGALAAMAAALCMQNFGGGLKWFCLWETPPFILCYYLGIVAFRNREALDALCMRRPVLFGGCLAALIFLLWPHAAAPVAGWAVSLLCALLGYHLSLLAAAVCYSRFQTCRFYTWFERNGFRFYLFHMPTPLLVFMCLYKPLQLPPVAFILLNVVITFAVTTGIVLLSHKIEKKLPLRGRANTTAMP
jgi:hypothetical protein